MAPSCEECIKGTIHAGQPLGSEAKLHGLNTYITGNRTSPKATIVIYSDIFGLALPNNKLIADAYARHNSDYLVYLPDFFEGDPVGLKFADVAIPVDASKQGAFAKYTGLLTQLPAFLMWMGRHKQAHCEKVCMDFLAALRRATPRSQKIGMTGFCWGGKYAIRAGLESNMIELEGAKVPLVDAVVALHPSNLVLPEDVTAPVVPMTFGWGVEDQGVSFETKAKVEKIHADAEAKGSKVPEMQHQVYKPGRHGFAVRGNPDDPAERKCLEDSVTQAMDWFKRWL